MGFSGKDSVWALRSDWILLIKCGLQLTSLMIQKRYVTNKRPQSTSFDPKPECDQQRDPTDLRWSKNVTWPTPTSNHQTPFIQKSEQQGAPTDLLNVKIFICICLSTNPGGENYDIFVFVFPPTQVVMLAGQRTHSSSPSSPSWSAQNRWSAGSRTSSWCLLLLFCSQNISILLRLYNSMGL